jgi:hypothetical protein
VILHSNLSGAIRNLVGTIRDPKSTLFSTISQQ